MTDWSGSAAQRKPQGTCRPPVQEEPPQPRFILKSSTYCYIRKVGERNWRHHVTKMSVGFDSFEESSGPYYVFRDRGFQLRVLKRRVADRNKT